MATLCRHLLILSFLRLIEVDAVVFDVSCVLESRKGCTAEIDIVARVCNCLLACFNVILKFLVVLVDNLEHDSSVAASYRTNESARSSLCSCSEN